MHQRIVVRFTMLVFLLIPVVALAAPFRTIIIFGDSLSDSGNLSLATKGEIPGEPYVEGRFSNGFNYADRLAANLGLSLAPSLAGGTNFAFGGARTDSHPFGGLSLRGQLAAFTDALGDRQADPEALYVVFAGANNLQDALLNPDNAAALVLKAVADMQSVIETLAAKGAHHILVPNLPNLGLVPRVTEREVDSPGISAFATLLTLLFNDQLQRMLDTFPDLNLIRFDTFARLQEVVASPAAFGFRNVTERCYTGDDLTFTGGGRVCATPETYLFWDGIHPTAAGHTILGDLVTAALGFDLFATFHIEKLEIRQDKFETIGTFTLGAESDGIDPLSEDVTLQVESFAMTIPAGSFTFNSAFTFEGAIDRVRLEVKIMPLGDNGYAFKAEGTGIDLTGTGNPGGVTLGIGDDTASASAVTE